MLLSKKDFKIRTEISVVVLKLIGLISTFTVITVIDMPKLKATANKRKYLAVYYSIIVAGIALGILEILQIVPDCFKSLAFYFQKLSGLE
jgi:uncharacterized membrane protein